MKLSLASLALLAASASAFTAVTPAGRASTSLNILAGTQSATERVANVMAARPEENEAIDALVKKNFPGAISNKAMETKIASILEAKGFTPANTLLCTSLCCDELARNLEDDLNKVYGHNFNLGGLSGFPFAGNTGFGAMSAHVPDDGFCLLVHGPHVGISKDGVIGKVERSGIALVDNCCGSAIAASNYLKGITDGGAKITTKLQQFSDFQQGAVQELILPHGKRLNDADNRMKELPYALYDSQDILVRDIINGGKGGIKQGLALLSGIQINTGPDTLDYFHPLRFDYYDADGNVVESMIDELSS
ncbi:limiting CO2-inducible proteins B/C beta carbonic anhydrase domain-containing protein [Skeletonema marinoi]|uniref:Limiting CO2-inducible proteins B/C beta carbonic anhydrase domain-containing protein n=1 Tax=Skeletonema marinoi TaxID=267567 RepID=A0A7S2LVP2_9STRA|nr:limiting CO2-inducible proteins B/C beta carbonic anhydrase domain-containing protein [Skeletonema marinoi]